VRILTRSLAALTATATLAGACAFYKTPTLPPVPASIGDHQLSRRDAVADAEFLFRTLEDVHPNLYAHMPKDSVQRMRDRLTGTLGDSISRPELWTRFAVIVASLHDAHTSVYQPAEDLAAYRARGGFLAPLNVARDDTGALVLTGIVRGDTSAHRGDRLLAVNAHPADSLLDVFSRQISDERDWQRPRRAAAAFSFMLYLNGVRAPYAVRVRATNGTVREITYASMPVPPASTTGAATPPPPARHPNFQYRFLPDRIAYLDFYSMGGDIARFKTDLGAAFTKMAADSARGLIVDVRRNGGGDSQFGDELLAHMTSTPYRLAARKEWKMSHEYRSYLKHHLNASIRWLPIEYLFGIGRRMFSGPDGKIMVNEIPLDKHKRVPPAFAGPLCLLAGAGTFSSATMLVDAVKTYKLGTVIGEETGGLPTAFGDIYMFQLPASRFTVSVSSATWVRASGDTTEKDGVMPDVPARQTPLDIRNGRDPVLTAGIACAGSMMGTSTGT
jgi:hypothetical protein